MVERTYKFGLGMVGALVALTTLAVGANAWTGTDTAALGYNAKDNMDGLPGRPTNVFASYADDTDWTCPSPFGSSAVTGDVRPTGFDFDFYGTAIARIIVASEGWLSFMAVTSASSGAPPAIPSTIDPDNVVAGWWADLAPNGTPGNRVCYKSEGTGADQRFLVWYDDVAHGWSGETGTVNFVAILHERGDAVELHYDDSLGDSGYQDSIGIEDGTGGKGIQYARGTSLVRSTEAVQFRPKASYPEAMDDGDEGGDGTVEKTAYKLDQGKSAALDTLTVTATDGVLANDRRIGNVALAACEVGTTAVGSCAATVDLTTKEGGTVKLASDGSFVYTPKDEDFCAVDSFEYVALDDWPSSATLATGKASILVEGCNEAPVASDGSASTTEDTALSVPAASGLASLSSDADGDALTFSVVGSPTGGAVTITPATGAYTFTPTADACSATTGAFTYRASDGKDSDTGIVTLSIACTDDAPVAVADGFSATEDTALVLATAAGLRANDSDPDTGYANDAASGLGAATVMIESGPSRGVLVLDADGAGGFAYTPDADFHGTDSFQYRLVDAAPGVPASALATATIEVAPVNDAPVGAADAYTLVAGETLAVALDAGLLLNDADVDGDTIAAVLLEGPSFAEAFALDADGTFDYTPVESHTDDDAFTYRPFDGAAYGAPVTVVLDIEVPNPDLIARSDSYDLVEDVAFGPDEDDGLTAHDTIAHPEDPISIVLVEAPAHGALTSLLADGSFTYVPDLDFNGIDRFRYRLEQATYGVSNNATVTLLVASVNDAPEAADVDLGCLDEDTVLAKNGLAGLLAGASDLHAGAPDEGQSISLAGIPSPPALGTLATSSDGSFTYTPDADAFGSDAFTFTVKDSLGATSVPYVASLCVTPVGDAPTGSADAYVAYLGAIKSVAAPGVLGNDADVDPGEAATLAVAAPATLTKPNGAKLELLASGAFAFTPPATEGLVSFTYRPRDMAGLVAATDTTVTFDVKYNTPPVPAFTLPARVAAGQAFTATDTSSDADGPIVARAWDFGTPTPAGLTAPSHIYGYPGTYTVSLTVTDEAGAVASTSRTIAVDPMTPAAASAPNTDPGSAGARDYTNAAPPPAPAATPVAAGPAAPAFVVAEQPATAPGASPATPVPVAPPPALVVDAGPDLEAAPGGTVRLAGRLVGDAPVGAWQVLLGAGRLSDPLDPAAELDLAGHANPEGLVVLRLTGGDRSGAIASDSVEVRIRGVPGSAGGGAGAAGSSGQGSSGLDGQGTPSEPAPAAATRARGVATASAQDAGPWTMMLGIGGALAAVALLGAIAWAARRP